MKQRPHGNKVDPMEHCVMASSTRCFACTVRGVIGSWHCHWRCCLPANLSRCRTPPLLRVLGARSQVWPRSGMMPWWWSLRLWRAGRAAPGGGARCCAAQWDQRVDTAELH